MGMFDTIMADFNCPHCAYKISKEYMEDAIKDKDAIKDNDRAWQTKATDCSLNNYKIGDKLEFRNLRIQNGWMQMCNTCPKCKKFVEVEIEIKDNRLTDKIVYLEATSASGRRDLKTN